MKFSKYNHIFHSAKYGFLLYNSETNSFAELDEKLYLQFSEIESGNIDITEIDSTLINELIKAKVLVANEKSFYYEKKFRYYLNNFNPNLLRLAIAPTTFCNFNCPYCYEENRKPVFMSKETEDNLIKFIKKHKTVDSVDITWYGGEPLANFKSIQNILEKISENIDVKLGSHSMITNGYLLDEEKSQYFSQHQLDSIQITIDGNKNSHDRRRILQNGGATYDTIIENIEGFLKYNKNTRILIRVNIDATNSTDFITLYNNLMDRWTNKNIFVYPAFVRDYTDSCSTNCSTLQHEDKVKFYMNLYEKHGLMINFYPDLRIGGCGATSINYYVVGPKGELYKCWNDIGVDEKIIGFLNNDSIPQQDILTQYIVGPTMFEDEECKSCKLFPICDGGCHWMRLKNKYEGKNYDLCTNRKNHLDKFLELHYEMKLKKIQAEY